MAQHKRRHLIGGPGLPKGATPLPTGGYIFPDDNPRVVRDRRSEQHTIRVQPVYRDEPDIKRLAQVLLDVARTGLADADPTRTDNDRSWSTQPPSHEIMK